MKLWRELFDPEAPESRGQRVQSIVFELAVVGRAWVDLWDWAKIIPNQPGVLAPAGLARHFDVSFMLNATWANANAALTSFLLLLGLSGRFRGAYLLALLTFHLQYVARFCIGKINHGANIVGFSILALGLAQLAFSDPTLRRKAALGFALLLFGVGYTWAGICKLEETGIRWADGHHLWLWIDEKYVDGLSSTGRGHRNTLQRMVLESSMLGTLLLLGGLLVELTSWLMWWRLFRRWVMFALVGMHIGIWVAMDIRFTGNVIVLLSLSLPIAALVDSGRAHALRWLATSDQP